MPTPQAGILAPIPPFGRHLTFDLLPHTDPVAALQDLAAAPPAGAVIGLGASLVSALEESVEGLRVFPALAGRGVGVPSTQNALWVWLRGETVADCFDAAQQVQALLADSFSLVDEIGAFMYHDGRDLSGYVDGTENPQGADAEAAAIVAGGRFAGSSFAALQVWQHDLPEFQSWEPQERDDTFGRSAGSNQELEDAPDSAHVKRSAQESFDPPAFIVRRSMPWSEQGQHGLVFLAFGESLDRFERILRRMVGLDDGVVDGLFGFTRPISGGYYWCPPMRPGGGLDLSMIGL